MTLCSNYSRTCDKIWPQAGIFTPKKSGFPQSWYGPDSAANFMDTNEIIFYARSIFFFFYAQNFIIAATFIFSAIFSWFAESPFLI